MYLALNMQCVIRFVVLLLFDLVQLVEDIERKKSHAMDIT
jgi:hypothetical protein